MFMGRNDNEAAKEVDVTVSASAEETIDPPKTQT